MSPGQRVRAAPVLICVLGVVVGLAVRQANAQALEESEFEAALTFNIAKFVEWPAEAFKGPRDPIVLCVLGQASLLEALKPAADREVIPGRKLRVQEALGGNNASGCHILFVGSSEKKHWKAIIGGTRNSNVLTIGESEGFAVLGGVINFKREGDHLGIQINTRAAERKKLRVSSRLLSLSEIVNE